MNAGFDKKAFKCKYDYCIGKAADLNDPSLQALAQGYKRRLSASMRAIAGQDISKIPSARNFYVTKKYDGEFAFVVFDGESIVSLNPNETVRAGLPALEEAAKQLKKAKIDSCILAAEYHLLGASPNARALEQVLGVLRKPSSKAALDKIGLAVFDIVEKNGKPVGSVADVFSDLTKWFGKSKIVHPVEYVKANSVDGISEQFVNWVVGDAAEGLVVRHDKLGSYKIKVKHNLDVAIIGFSEGTEGRKGMLHDLLVAVVRPDGTFQELTRVGGGFSDDDRKTFVKDLKKRIVPSEYVAVNNDYVAYEMIEPGPVIEISCLDLIAERSRGGPVNRMVLEWTGERYQALSRMPLVSVISPQYIRMRDDKEASPEDTSITQVSELAPVAKTEEPAGNTKLSPSKLLERTVYTKVMKENTMVRKLLLWKTNKEESTEFPAYVVYLTDFSPNRQTPLERDVKVANSEKAAREMFKELAKKKFIGGWEKAA